jgi:small multidrug resistance pump
MSSVLFAYGALAMAIICEVIGTAFLQRSEQFTQWAPTAAMAAFYVASLYFLAQALKAMPLGIAYAIWGGLGIVLTAIVGVTIFKQALDAAAMIGIAMIVGGVVVVNVFSDTLTHGS